MSSFRRRLIFRLYLLSDLLILIAALLVTSIIVSYPDRAIMSPKEFLFLRVRVINFIGFLGMLLVWHMAFNIFHLYRSRRLDSEIKEIRDIILATSLGTIIFAVFGSIFHISAFTLEFLFIFWSLSIMFTIMFRTLLRFILRTVRRYGRNLRFILIIGTNQRAYDFAQNIEERKETGYRLLGYIDRDIHEPREGVRLLGSLKDFPQIIKDHIVDMVVITLPIKSCYDEIRGIVQAAEEQGISIQYLPDMFNTKIAKARVEDLEDFSVLTFNSGYHDSGRYMVKRAIDLLIGALLLIITFPLLLIVAMAIKLSSRGPVLFVQDRVGYNKRIFPLYKFRTMVAGAEQMQQQLEGLNEISGPVFKIHNDPRVTPIGRWLRKTSIDELPQLFNILKGDMSLVGPRPLPVRDYSGFDQDWQRRRFSVLPGLTCTWQVNGRNNIPFEEWMRMDMEYIDTWSLSNDIKILFKTIPAVVKGKGAA